MRHYKWLFLVGFSFLFLLPLQAIDFTISGQVSLFTEDVPAPFNRLTISDESGTYTANVRTNFQGQYKAVFDLPEGEIVTFELSIKDVCTNELLIKTTTSALTTASVNFILCNEDLIDPIEEEDTSEEDDDETDGNDDDGQNNEDIDDIIALLDSLDIDIEGLDQLTDILYGIDGQNIEDIDDIIALLDSLDIDIDGIDGLTDILDGIDGQSIEDVDDIIALLDSLDIDIEGLDGLTDILDGIDGQNIEDVDDIIALLDSLDIDIDGIDDLTDILDGIDGQSIEDIDDIIALLDSLDIDVDGIDQLTDILDGLDGQNIEDIDGIIGFLDSLGIDVDGLTDIFEEEEETNDDIIGSLFNQCQAFYIAYNDGLTVQFIDINLGNVKELDWDFGDGNTSADKNPEHTYAEEGVYTVRLSITTKKGCTSEYSTDVTVATGGLIGTVASKAAKVATKPVLTAATLYPTNVQDEVNLMLTFVENTDFEVQVLSINGYAIYRQKYTAFRGDNALSLSMLNIPSGIYLAQIRTNNGVESLKFVKN